MRYTDAVASFRGGKATKFALAGPEQFLKEQFARMVRAQMGADVFWPEEAGEALSRMSTPGLFPGERATVLMDFEKMKPERFVDAIRGTSDVLVLVLGEKADIKSRAMTEVLGCVAGVSCESLKEWGDDYPRWIASLFEESGLKADGGVPGAVYRRVGPEMAVLAKEVDKLALVMGKGGRVTVEDVTSFVSATARATAFEILEDLLKRNVPSALARFATWRGTSESGLDLVRFLSNHLEKVYRMLLLREKGFGPDEIAHIIGMPPFLVKSRYLPWASALGKSNISSKLDALCELDGRLRTFRGDKRIMIDRFIYSFF